MSFPQNQSLLSKNPRKKKLSIMATSNVNGEWQVINWSKSAADEQQLKAELRA